jgi:succinoglycan biosynthesis transport protein ExoP
MDVRTRQTETYDGPHRHPNAEAQSDMLDLDYLFAAAKRRFPMFLAACAIGIALGVVYIITAVPQYTASTDLLMDDRRPPGESDAAALTGVGFDSVAVDSQVEVVKSGKIGSAVVDALQLHKDPRHMSSEGDILGHTIGFVISSVKGAFSPERHDLVEVDEEAALKRYALGQLQKNLTAERIARTHVLRVSYRSTDRQLASRIANGYAEAYLTDQLDSKYEATKRASSWLQERIEELRQAAISSDLAVQKYRTDHNLLAPKGVLVSDQQLSELNSQLILARAASAQAEARYRRIRLILDSGQTDAAVSEALDNPVINKLRSSYLDASKKESEFSKQVGENHIQTVRLRGELREYERLIFDELKRIAESYESDFQVAKAREQNLTESLSGAVGIAAGANVTLVALRQLEREAETYRNLHQTFLQRYQEAVQRQSFPITEARVITRAAVPGRASHPRTPLVLVLSLLVGGAIGVSLGALFEFRDRAFRTGDQVRSELGLEFLGMLPRVEARRLRRSRIRTWRRMLTGARKPAAQVELTSSLMRHVLDSPLSQFAETLRSVKVAIDLSLINRSKLIGVVSVLPGEGKTTVAMNLAALIAHQGATVLLIDGDMRKPGLTRAVAPRSKVGLVEALLDKKPVEELYVTEPESKLTILPSGGNRRVTHTSELLSSPAMAQLLRTAQKNFDYVILDLPPMGVVVDVRAVAPTLEAFVLVTEWGRTMRKAVRSTLAADQGVREKCIGAILNKVDGDQLRRYESYGSIEYYTGKYTGYYRDGK